MARGVAAGGLAVAAGAHLAAFPDHRAEGLAIGAFFVVVAVVQLGAAALLTRGAAARTRAGVAAMTAAVLALWALSRTEGLPFGSHAGTAERVGALDLIAAVAQVVTLAALLRTRTGRARVGSGRPLVGLSVLAAAVGVSGALFAPSTHTAADHAHPDPAARQGHEPRHDQPTGGAVAVEAEPAAAPLPPPEPEHDAGPHTHP